MKVLVVVLRVIGMFLSQPICLLAKPCDMGVIARPLCGEERERVSHQRFGSTFVVDLGG